MYDFSSVFFIFLFSNPFTFKSWERAQSWTTSPYWVISIWSSNDLNHICLWANCIKFLLKSIWETFVESSSSGKNYILVKIFSNINIAILNWSVAKYIHSSIFISFFNETWIEESFGSHKSWSIYWNCLSIWKFEVLGVLSAFCSFCFISCWIERDETKIFFNFSYNLVPSRFSSLFWNSFLS